MPSHNTTAKPKPALFIDRSNVGRIAERIVANELEAHGFRVSDLNKEGVSTNADLLAVGHRKTWQIQIKGATNQRSRQWWVQYGYCTPEIIKKKSRMFNRRKSFYSADIIVLVAVRSPTDYCCVVLKTKDAERAAQLNLDRSYRTRTRSGTEKKPNKVYVTLDPTPREHTAQGRDMLVRERRIVKNGLNAWGILLKAG